MVENTYGKGTVVVMSLNKLLGCDGDGYGLMDKEIVRLQE